MTTRSPPIQIIKQERIFRNYDAYIKYLDEVVLVMEIAIEQGEGAILKCKLERDLL